MTFDFPGYDLQFIQKQRCHDATAHLFSLKYKFFSPVTGYWYILHAEYHDGDVFGLKFYCKKDSHSDFKYSKIVNKGDLGNILMTCAKSVPLILRDYPTASFAFGAARSVDKNNKTVEPVPENQRFKTYSYLAAMKFGSTTFQHYAYPLISCYMLVNRACGDVALKEQHLKAMFSQTYSGILNP